MDLDKLSVSCFLYPGAREQSHTSSSRAEGLESADGPPKEHHKLATLEVPGELSASPSAWDELPWPDSTLLPAAAGWGHALGARGPLLIQWEPSVRPSSRGSQEAHAASRKRVSWRVLRLQKRFVFIFALKNLHSYF